MRAILHRFKPIVVALLLTGLEFLPVHAQDSARLDQLFEQLQDADRADLDMVEQEIWTEWSRSGSSAMDLLLLRGRAAMEAQDFPTAIDFFSALVDHAPDFPEGWNARATAYFHAGLFGPSIEDIRHVLALEPRHFGAIAGLAMIMEELGRTEEALAAWREVEKLTPHKESVQENIRRLETLTGGRTL
jgi:tetratricopeptide (TPR) repeat protein